MKCPGQDRRFWKFEDICVIKCPNCGRVLEFFKDEPRLRCKGCGEIVFNPRNWEKAVMESASLLQAVNHLFTLLDERGIEYVLVGGVALLNYVEGRNTQDIDLIMALPDLAKVPEIEVESQDNPYFARGEFDGLQIDILLRKNPLFQLVKQKYTEKLSFLEQEIW